MEIVCDDCFHWLKSVKKQSIDCVFTSIPDLEDIFEFGVTPGDHQLFVESAFKEISRVVRHDGYLVFSQTDRKSKEQWVDKTYVIIQAAKTLGWQLLWHKVVLDKHGADPNRPTYSHLVCFSQTGGPGRAFPDLLHRGFSLYRDGTSFTAAAWVIKFFKEKGLETLVDPFAGRFTIPWIASQFGMKAIGVDIDPEQCQHGEDLEKRSKKLKIILADIQLGL